MEEIFFITPSGKAPASFRLIMGVVAAAVVVGICIPAVGSFPPWLLAAGALVLVIVAAAFKGNSRIEVGPGTLRLRVPFYGRTLSIRELDLDQARVVDLSIETGLKLRIKTNGIGLPGYAVGWFRLRDKQKALAAVTGKQHAVYIPTRGAYCLLLSAQEPQRFLETLKQNSPGS